ncbi:MAG TPA: PQQ-binding-like beta-propeller repeat protein [Pseudonocardiaceae bacterium]
MPRRYARFVVSIIALFVIVMAPGANGAAAPGLLWSDWSTWQHDTFGSRFNPAERAITPGTASQLTLKWAFAYPRMNNGAMAKSQPAVVDGVAYFGSTDAKFYALDAHTGQTRWVFDLSTVAPITGDASVWDGPTVVDGRVYFGDHRGYLYSLDAVTGSLVWATHLSSHPMAIITSSPLYFDGRIYIGVSSSESAVAADYPCCTARGQVVAVDARTGTVDWRYYTVPQARQVGTWPSGAARMEPSGVSVWSSPVIDPTTRTLYVGTGQNYTGTTGDSDSVLALDTTTGAVRWKQQMTHPDTWRLLCRTPDATGYCPGNADGSAKDFDLGSTANIFTAGGRTLVGIGQKNGIYHVFDAVTGQIAWQRQLSDPQANSGISGVQWGGAYDGRTLYVATWEANPGTLFALDPATGAIRWQAPNPSDGCAWGGAAAYPSLCVLGHTPAVTASPGLVYLGSTDGKLRVYSSSTGAVLWQYDTVRDFVGVNGLTGHGSALSGNGGAVVSGGMVFVQSGYYPFYPTDKGYVLLAFGL